jgi:hypothetical protein
MSIVKHHDPKSEPSIFPVSLVRTGDKISVKAADGRWIFRKIVSQMTMEGYNVLLNDLTQIVNAANAGHSQGGGNAS